MKQQIAAGILAASMVGGVGTGVMAHQLRSGSDPEPKAKPSATATTKKPEKPKSTRTAAPGGTTGGGGPIKTTTPPSLPIVPVGSLRITAGAVGPVQVGMTKLAAYGTGYFDADVSVPACNRIDDLVWKTGYSDQLDVLTHDDGSIASIGIRGAGPRTRAGLGVGSTYESVLGVIGEVAPEAAGYGQTGLFVSEGAGWIGFLFNTAPEAITGTDTVTFVEVTSGA
ncbi:MAG: hypothetical protein JWR83_1789 [Aeromicrobium sp.]|nr:hypothetical protein [Aeromicrobium sp.]